MILVEVRCSTKSWIEVVGLNNKILGAIITLMV